MHVSRHDQPSREAWITYQQVPCFFLWSFLVVRALVVEDGILLRSSRCAVRGPMAVGIRVVLLLRVDVGAWWKLDVPLLFNLWCRVSMWLVGGVDAAGGAWQRGSLWREGMGGDDGIMSAGTRLALAICPGGLLALVCVFLVVCVVAVVVGSTGWSGVLRSGLVSRCRCGRTWHRRALGFHGRQSGSQCYCWTGIR